MVHDEDPTMLHLLYFTVALTSSTAQTKLIRKPPRGDACSMPLVLYFRNTDYVCAESIKRYDVLPLYVRACVCACVCMSVFTLHFVCVFSPLFLVCALDAK